jgi:hypothetical protein
MSILYFDISRGGKSRKQIFPKRGGKMAKKQKYEWFVKPLDDFTNQAITDLLSKTADVDEICELNFDQDKITNVLRVNYGTVQLIQYSKKHMPLMFRIFNRRGPNGQVREWKFPRRRKPVETRRVQKELAKMSEK